jgi:hypothetical protein
MNGAVSFSRITFPCCVWYFVFFANDAGGLFFSHNFSFQVSTRPSLVFSLRPLSRSLPALSIAALPLAAGLSVWDAMENEVDLWEI